jgi:hypothetical protein
MTGTRTLPVYVPGGGPPTVLPTDVLDRDGAAAFFAAWVFTIVFIGGCLAACSAACWPCETYGGSLLTSRFATGFSAGFGGICVIVGRAPVIGCAGPNGLAAFFSLFFFFLLTGRHESLLYGFLPGTGS